MTDVPLVVNFQGDFVLQLVSVDSQLTMDKVAEAAAFHSVNRRVKPREGTLRVKRQDGEPFPRDLTVSEAGLEQMETIVVYWQQD